MLDTRRAMNHLVERHGLRRPHLYSVRSPSGTTVWTEAEWNSYGWNPHPDYPNEGVDPHASPKPTWAELVQADIDVHVMDFQEREIGSRRLLSGTVQGVISETVYGAHSITHEEHIKSRLAGTDLLTRMNHTRDHYRQRYHEIKHWINSIPRTEAGKRSVVAWEAVAVTVDRYGDLQLPQAFRDLFTGARWTPPGTAEPYAAHSGIPVYQHHDPGTPPFDLELTVDTAVANDAGDQVMALHIFATAKATFTLTYPTVASIHADREATGSPVTEVDSAKPHGCTTTLWIKRREGDTGEREMTAEISVFASPYGVLNGAKTTVTFPAGG